MRNTLLFVEPSISQDTENHLEQPAETVVIRETEVTTFDFSSISWGK